MGILDRSAATLRIFGDELIPEDVSKLLGAMPSKSFHKGEEEVGAVTGKVRIHKTGSWRLSVERRSPENLDAQIFEILNQLSQDLTAWKFLCSHYRVDLFCGIFMASFNDGLTLSPEALLALGARGIRLDMDIYNASE
ncbi:DUF4279 domain-containing protein [Pseudomonas sp. EA_35y_Pfl2_R5]|uniref:DUF4279 domain-containing protein n=1 Tax=Pseudomonas sp. EA_35y_Pfl2_R5 TaxID=3088690 RepID=UPI0030D9FD3C